MEQKRLVGVGQPRTAAAGNAWVSTQSPQPGTLVEPDSTVTMRLRTGPIL